ncbi:LysR family transcriptional regulator [Rhizobium mongolense]|uniref:DNA-binding transcriptional LysR family regulator n=2 Tax=Rhizobium mongolense TaxID=57676 RepID=A0ABR6IH58_9HYPH|nr:LysR family transcriptional regulator [Rhizobium mongolense]MBB4227198.1 DNA-binding transcriptional LysR family regulator [Rhizobium mongolense]TVZ74363.1 DNA-binding transcriptional LysR family regulator [Rhizobium mongolense USDA 1844]
MSVTLRHIEVFHAVMTTGSVTGAADMLKTSQPTVSRELARFEYLIQIKLFERIRGRLRPTAHALQLFEEVQRAYFGLDRIVRTATSLRRFEQGQLSIVCLPVFSQSLLPQTCRLVAERFPDVGISITPQESPLLEEWLSAQRYDFGLTEIGHAPQATEATALVMLDEVCVLPDGHPLLRKTILSPGDFEGQPFVSLSATDSYRQQIDRIFRETGTTRRMVIDTHSAASICAMVREGIGLAIVNPLTALDYAHNGVHIRPFSVSIPFSVNIVRPIHRPPSRLVEIFESALIEQAKLIKKQIASLVSL